MSEAGRPSEVHLEMWVPPALTFFVNFRATLTHMINHPPQGLIYFEPQDCGMTCRRRGPVDKGCVGEVGGVPCSVSTPLTAQRGHLCRGFEQPRSPQSSPESGIHTLRGVMRMPNTGGTRWEVPGWLMEWSACSPG